MKHESRADKMRQLEDALLEHIERCSKCTEGIQPSIAESAILATVPKAAMALIELWKTG